MKCVICFTHSFLIANGPQGAAMEDTSGPVLDFHRFGEIPYPTSIGIGLNILFGLCVLAGHFVKDLFIIWTSVGWEMLLILLRQA